MVATAVSVGAIRPASCCWVESRRTIAGGTAIADCCAVGDGCAARSCWCGGARSTWSTANNSTNATDIAIYAKTATRIIARWQRLLGLPERCKTKPFALASS